MCFSFTSFYVSFPFLTTTKKLEFPHVSTLSITVEHRRDYHVSMLPHTRMHAHTIFINMYDIIIISEPASWNSIDNGIISVFLFLHYIHKVCVWCNEIQHFHFTSTELSAWMVFRRCACACVFVFISILYLYIDEFALSTHIQLFKCSLFASLALLIFAFFFILPKFPSTKIANHHSTVRVWLAELRIEQRGFAACCCADTGCRIPFRSYVCNIFHQYCCRRFGCCCCCGRFSFYFHFHLLHTRTLAHFTLYMQIRFNDFDSWLRQWLWL